MKQRGIGPAPWILESRGGTRREENEYERVKYHLGQKESHGLPRVDGVHGYS